MPDNFYAICGPATENKQLPLIRTCFNGSWAITVSFANPLHMSVCPVAIHIRASKRREISNTISLDRTCCQVWRRSITLKTILLVIKPLFALVGALIKALI